MEKENKKFKIVIEETDEGINFGVKHIGSFESIGVLEFCKNEILKAIDSKTILVKGEVKD